MSKAESDPVELKNHAAAARRNPSAYSGTVKVEGLPKEVSVKRAAEDVECGPILDRHGRWAITEYGIECLGLRYPIASNRVHENDWLRHLSQKTWFSVDDERDFVAIWNRAKERWPAE